MFRAVLTILVGLPMLMPPGMCLCEYLPCPTDGIVAVSEAGSPAAEELSSQTHRCSCGHRRLLAELGREAVSEAVGSKHIHSDPFPKPEKHHPGCPAVDEHQSRFVVRTETVVPPPAIIAEPHFVIAVEHVFAVGAERVIESPSNPLVISHGPLLI